jgi:DNA mismatch repair ATPase MutS
MTSHGLRKFFFNQCEKANLNYTTLQLLAGHKLRKVDRSYKKSTEEDMLAEYVRAIPFLTIDQTQRLKQENQKLKKDYLAELGELREEFNEMKQLLVHLSKDSQKQLVNEFYQMVGDKADIEWSCDD